MSKKALLILTILCILGIYGAASAQDMFKKAEPATFPIIVKDKQYQPQVQPYVIEGRLYLSVADMGQALDIPVQWDAALKQVEIDCSPNLPSTNSISK